MRFFKEILFIVLFPVMSHAGQCDIPPESGPPALFQNSKVKNIVTSDFFEKRYNRADLEAIENSSTDSTIAYALALGISVYQVPDTDPKADCLLFRKLNPAPAAVLAKWKQATSGLVANTELQGLFFENCTTCSPTLVQNPTILINESADRWTAVHEMMHFNFDRTRKLEPGTKTADELTSADQEMSRNIGVKIVALTKSQALADFVQLSRLLHQALHIELDFVKRFTLEEIAVEGTLLDEFLAGRYRNVSPLQSLNSVWYMNASRTKFIEIFRKREHLLFAMRDHAIQAKWPVDDLNAALQELKEIRDESGIAIQTRAQILGMTNVIEIAPDSSSQLAEKVRVLNPHIEELSNREPMKKMRSNMNRIDEQITKAFGLNPE